MRKRFILYISLLLRSFILFLEADVKSNINSLRTYYTRELNKELKSKKSGAGRNDIVESKWPHFKSLLFLRDSIIPRKTTSNLVSIFFISVKNLLSTALRLGATHISISKKRHFDGV